MDRVRGVVAVGAVLLAACAPAVRPGATVGAPTVVSQAGDGAQRFADLRSCTLDSGEKIEECRVGYRTFGKLNQARSNVVLFPTWFTGTTQQLVELVPGKLVDTSRFFLVLVDALGDGVSSAPSNSRRQPRLRFPRFTIHDMVETQRRVLREVLGVEIVDTVMGISMGGMQAYEWAVSHPDEVRRIVPIMGTPQLTAQDLLLWTAELHILEGSTAYANGEYGEPRPAIPALQEVHWLMLHTPAHRNAETSRAGFTSWARAKGQDTFFDWNDWHRQLEAMLAHDVARGTAGDLAATARSVKAKALVVVAEHDQMVNPEPSKIFAKAMNAKLVVSDSPCGHAAPSCDETLAPAVRRFLED